MTPLTRQLYGEFGEEGIEVLEAVRGKGSHVKVRCRFQGHSFIYVTTENGKTWNRGVANRAAELRRIKRAIRTQNHAILGKYKVVRDGQ